MNERRIVARGGKFVADSREVARVTETRHHNLIAKIDGFVKVLVTDLNFKVSDFFLETSYQDTTGRTLKRYDITRKGCDMVANKTTRGKESCNSSLRAMSFSPILGRSDMAMWLRHWRFRFLRIRDESSFGSTCSIAYGTITHFGGPIYRRNKREL
ncbi:Rha family transcriptional regulator [Alicyclobacillus sp. SO9]|uniref:Rha family transcriptional regulator n=1 Tax=Alicyclobacillus sp. SO9 TaxID=2665646 RepID=UPI0018E74AA0|nr:Rha family transcriptional regulator [Alicyclobacillus sp. SO9]QQE81543.1 Rha family transcriptional regulator [Alicyclobacillus sp. SO9]